MSRPQGQPPRNIEALIEASSHSAPTFWREVADLMSEALLFVGPDRRIIDGNRRAQSLMRFPLAEARGRMCTDAIACPQCECTCRLFQEGSVDGVEVALYPPGHDKPRLFRKYARLIHDAEGNVIGGVESFTDVSAEIEEREEKQRRSNLLLREKRRSEALIDGLSDGVFSADESLRVRDFSQRMTEMTGYARSDAVGRNFIELLGLEAALPGRTESNELPEHPIAVDLRKAEGGRASVRLSFVRTRYGSDEVLGVVSAPAPSRGHDELAQMEREYGYCGLISASPAMRHVFEVIESTAGSDVPILVEGESGTGKELVSRAIHARSQRSSAGFYAINCATLAGGTLLSELFGHVRGAFTGAITQQRGKLELAGRGTLLLDEVGEIPLEHQATLLRVLEDRAFHRVGGASALPLHARVVAATNRQLADAVEAGAFRRDLYHRLKVVPIELPPLRDRGGDIALLARYFALRDARDLGGPPLELGEPVMAALEDYRWPGNVRELKNLIEYLRFVSDGRAELSHLPGYITNDSGRVRSCPSPTSTTSQASPSPSPTIARAPAEAGQAGEREELIAALEATGYRRARAAARLGIDRTTLWRRMRKHGIKAP